MKLLFPTSVFLFFLAGCAPAAVPAPVTDIRIVPEQTLELPEPRVTIPAEHIVSAGDTLINIALSYGKDYRELANWNGLSNPDRIDVGQVLRLSPPPNESVPAAVQSATAPALKPSVKKSATPTLKKIAKPGATAAPSAAATEKPAAAIPADVPLKKSPLAVKYPYQKSLLAKRRKEWAAQTAAAAPSAPVPAAPAVAVPTAAAAGAPQATRDRFGVKWSWPAARRPDTAFSEARKGVDFYGKAGDPVFAAADGEVVYVGTGVKSYGRLVILKHNNDYLTAYAHNREIFVKEGDRLARGGKIAEFGDSGAERVMLHFEVRKSGKPIDPAQVLPPQ